MGDAINKKLYRKVLSLIKAMPLIMSVVTLLNTILSFCGIDLIIMSYIGGVSLMILLLMYLSSFVFGFGVSHRVFIYYCAANWTINIIDEFIGIPLGDRNMLLLYLIIAGIALMILFFLRMNEGSLPAMSIDKKKEDSYHKILYKYELLMIKTIPILTTGICVLNTTLSYLGIDWTIWSWIGGPSLLMILFMYLTSVVFRFCAYHRIFIHYIAIVWLINAIDWYTSAFSQYNTRITMLLFCIFTGITLFIALYLKLKSLKVKQ